MLERRFLYFLTRYSLEVQSVVAEDCHVQCYTLRLIY